MTIATLLLIIALILFVCAAFGVGARFNLTAAGLASLTLSLLIAGGALA